MPPMTRSCCGSTFAPKKSRAVLPTAGYVTGMSPHSQMKMPSLVTASPKVTIPTASS
jgi:hypothetical protein